MSSEKIIFVYQPNKILHYEKVTKDELKKVNGGMAPKCCIDWDPIKGDVKCGMAAV
jgi:bacteriocin-like protein